MQEWQKLKEENVYSGYRKIARREFQLPDGSIADFDVILSKGGAAVLAITEDNKIVCFKQFRPGPEKILYELPGGAIEKGEDPLEAMERELLEETGYEAKLEFIGDYYRDAYMSGTWKMFIGRAAKKIEAQKLDSTEFGEIVLLSVGDFKEKLFKGLMTDATLGYAGLYRLKLL